MTAERNRARDGWNAKELSELLTMYAKDNPDAIVKFRSSESGGYWPEGRGAMGVFTDEQVAIVDATRCGGTITLTLQLLSFEGKP